MTGSPSHLGGAGVWRGVNHVALVTPDLARTIAFYRNLLGMRVLFEARPVRAKAGTV